MPLNPAMQYSAEALKNLTENFEGLNLNAYGDSTGIPTIGYGSILYQDGTKVKMGDVITQQQADDLLLWEIGLKAASVNQQLNVQVSQHEFDALTDLEYNVGCGAIMHSSLLRYLNSGDEKDFYAQFLVWDHAGGKVIAGLLRRRQADMKWAMTQDGLPDASNTTV